MMIGGKTRKLTCAATLDEYEVTYWVAAVAEEDRIEVNAGDSGDDTRWDVTTATRIAKAVVDVSKWSRSAEGKRRIRALRSKVHAEMYAS